MLEGVQVDLAGVQRFVRQVVGVEFHQFDENPRVLFIQNLLNRFPLIVVRAAHADLDNRLPGRIGCVFNDLLRLLLRQRNILVVGEGREESFLIIHKQKLSHSLGLVGFHNRRVGFVILVRCPGHDDVHIGVIPALALFLNDQAVLRRNQTVGNRIGAVDRGGGEVRQRGGQGVCLHRNHFHVVKIPGDVRNFRCISRLRIHGDQSRGLQQLNASGKVCSVVRNTDLKGVRRSRGRCQSQYQRQCQRENLL